jgi:WD40 repeat protein
MKTLTSSFYVTGGTLDPEAPSYVERGADEELYDALTAGEFCYLLTARQMGKSSLMVRTTIRLRETGTQVVVFDLTGLGQNLSVEQWYEGLLGIVGEQLDLEAELRAFWRAQAHLGPLQRWLRALHQVVLEQVTEPLVIFIDEIDAVRSLPFSTDEFFAGIRHCFNRRTEHPEFRRLTFCLLGVAAPTDLIRDTRTTPFNIGRRIELTDFSETEAEPLVVGMELGEPYSAVRAKDQARNLLRRVLYWSGGHPYLTQRLCLAVAQDGSVQDAAGVDRVCEALFLSSAARERDDNLLFVRERLLRSEVDTAGLLELYRRVRRGQKVQNDHTNQLVSLLRLSGIVRVADGGGARTKAKGETRLAVRNRIYERVFDLHWVSVHMPDAEVRRQRAAFRRGLLRTAAASSAIMAVIGGLAFSERRTAQREAQERLMAEHYLYAADMNLAQRAWERRDLAGALELLEGHRPRPGDHDVRGFEWRHLWRLCQGEARASFTGHVGVVTSVAFSPDGRLLASGGGDRSVRLWEVATGREVALLSGHTQEVDCVAFSPDGRRLVSGSLDGTLKVWDAASRRPVMSIAAHTRIIWSAAFSPDGRRLATASDDKTIRVWDMAKGQDQTPLTLTGHTARIFAVAFAPDGKTLASAGDDTIRTWELAGAKPGAATLSNGRIFATEHFRRSPVSGAAANNRRRQPAFTSLAFSPDGSLLAAGGHDGHSRLWDVDTRKLLRDFHGHSVNVHSLSFSPDGKTLAAGAWDTAITLWDVSTPRDDDDPHDELLRTLNGHLAEVHSVAFSPDGRTLASASADGTLKLWTPAAKADEESLPGHDDSVAAVAFSPDSKRLATSGFDRSVHLWEVSGGRSQIPAVFTGHQGAVSSVAFSPDGRALATGSADSTIRLWDIATRQLLTRPLKRHALGINSVVFSPNGRILASAEGDNNVRLWDVTARPVRQIATLQAHTGPVEWVAFSPDGRTLASASLDKTIRLWDVARGEDQTPRILPPQGGHSLSIAFSPNGRLLAGGQSDGNVTLWDVARPAPRAGKAERPAATLKGVHGYIYSVAFSPDGSTLAVGSSDRVVKLFNVNVAARREVASLDAGSHFISSAVFSPDGRMLAAGGGNGRVRLWRAATFNETDRRRVQRMGSFQDPATAPGDRPAAGGAK